MAFESASGQKFPYTYDQVFDGLLRVLPRIGFKIQQQDKNLGRLRVSSGMSLLSWGENIDISVEDLDGQSTRVEVHSALKVQGTRQALITGEHRNTKNVNDIVFALNNYLKTQPKPQRLTPSAPREGIAPSTMNVCSQCGAANPVGSNFCGACGAALPPAKVQVEDLLCAKCGTRNPQENKFCESCGNRF